MPKISDLALVELVGEELEPLSGWRPLVCWDLDSTVCSTVHRRHIAHAIRDKTGEHTWDDYAMRCADDEPVEGSIALMHMLDRYNHIAISGRSGQARQLTDRWFTRHQVPISATILRPFGDHTPNGDWKVRVLRAIQGLGFVVSLFCEDWGEVAEQIRQETGIPVLGVNPFDPPELGAREGAI